MASVSAGVGLISGINTSSIISQLVAADSGPKTNLQNAVTTYQTQEQDLLTFSASLAAVQNVATSLNSPDVLNAVSATSSNSSVLSVTADSSATPGNYQLTPIQLAQTQSLVSNSFADQSATPVGAGTITIKQGGFVQSNTALSTLNGGQGVNLGKIVITDRSGTRTTVNLTGAQTIGDVISDINNATGIGVQASVQGNSIALADVTGQSASSVSVQDVSGGTTAESLGFTSGAQASGNTLVGNGVVHLGSSLSLSALNDGFGVGQATNSPDFQIHLQDGTSFSVSLGGAKTVQDVLNAINTAPGAAGKLNASISNDGQHIVLTDTSVGGNTLTVTASSGSEAAQDLGILGSAQAGGVLTGGNVLAGLNSVLLKDLNGGSGVGVQGNVELTDRGGNSATIDLSGASSLSDVITDINGAGLGLNASINSAGDGIQITDTTGKSVSNLIIADVGSSTIASKLNISTNSATTSVNSGDLNLQYVSDNTALASLNGGSGVTSGQIRLTDSTGASFVVDLSNSNTVGDVINAINNSGAHVVASINSAGDGIELTDTGNGSGTLSVAEVNSGTTASSLHLLSPATGNQINGAFANTITVKSTDTLSDVANALNGSGAPISASVTNDGTGYRLIVQNNNGGAAGQVLIDTGSTGVNLSTLVNGQNAVLQLGSGSSSSPGLTFTSSNNSFQQVVPGVSVQLSGTSATPVTVSITQNSQPLIDALNQFVSSYNAAATQLGTYVNYNTTTNTQAPLSGDPATLQAQQALTTLFTQSYGPAGNSITNLSQLGFSIANGQLSLDTTQLQTELTNNPTAVSSFLNTAKTGFAAQLQTQLTSLTDPNTGLIQARVNSINTQITDDNQQIAIWTARLNTETTNLQTEFLAMEKTLATLQSQQTQLGTLQNLFTPATTNSSGSTSASGSSSSGGVNQNLSSIG